MLRRVSSPIFLLLLLIACGALALWQNSAQSRGGVAAPGGVALGTVSVTHRVLDGVSTWFGDVGRTMFRRGSVVQDNQQLRAQLSDWNGRAQSLSRLQRENDELRGLLRMPKIANGKSVAADVIALDANNLARRITLDAGATRGVRAKDVVYTSEGVVGQVIQVSPLNSVVLLLTDGETGRVGAMTSRTGAKGILRGVGASTCEMEFMDSARADVREGDTILTSGLSDIFPRGLTLGRVLEVKRDKRYTRLTAIVEPAAHLDNISAALIRTQVN